MYVFCVIKHTEPSRGTVTCINVYVYFCLTIGEKKQCRKKQSRNTYGYYYIITKRVVSEIGIMLQQSIAYIYVHRFKIFFFFKRHSYD